MRHCSSVKDPDAEENILRVVLRDGVEVPLSMLRRNTYASSSCGVCGKATIESTLVRCAPVPRDRGAITIDSSPGHGTTVTMLEDDEGLGEEDSSCFGTCMRIALWGCLFAAEGYYACRLAASAACALICA